MSISADLQTRYSTETDQDWWSGMILSHSRAGTLYLCNDATAQQGAVDGTVRSFQAVPFQFELPSRSAEGRADLRLQICAIGGEAQRHVDAAIADPTEGILLRYGEWLRGDTTQQWDPLLSLTLTDVLVSETVVQATATAADLLNRPFPSVLYRIDTFPGLDRA